MKAACGARQMEEVQSYIYVSDATAIFATS